jgi:hypothetical protein
MTKIKVGFEVTDNWAKGDFREFITSLTKLPEKYELYIISNDDSSAYISSVGVTLGLPTTQVYVVNFTQDKLDKIDALGVEIYLENLKYVADQVEDTTNAYGIYVNELPRKYYAQPIYIVDFERLINGLNQGTCEESFEPKE